jgi:hypothetical protein
MTTTTTTTMLLLKPQVAARSLCRRRRIRLHANQIPRVLHLRITHQSHATSSNATNHFIFSPACTPPHRGVQLQQLSLRRSSLRLQDCLVPLQRVGCCAGGSGLVCRRRRRFLQQQG